MSYQLFWSCYWILVLFTIITSIAAIVKKYYKTGIPSLLLSIGMPIFSFVFAFSRDWLYSGEDELDFLFRQLNNGSWQAYFIVISNIILAILTFYHIYKIIQKKK